MKISPTLRRRFFAKLAVAPSGCVEFHGSRNEEGYGRIAAWAGPRGTPRLVRAHAASWFLKYGVWPSSLMHTCDNPCCVKIGHLREATHRENMADKIAKGRQPVGEQTTLNKLTTEEVLEIRELCATAGLTYAQIGEMYGVGPGQVWRIHARRDWRHLPGNKVKKLRGNVNYDLREMASRAGVSVETIKYRIKKGLSGDAIVAKKHRAPRKQYTLKTKHK